MTTIPGEPVAAADAQPSSASLHSLHLSVLLVSLPFGLLVLGLPLIARELGASAVAIGGLFSIYSLIIVVLQPIVGHGLDRFGRRPFLIVRAGLRLLNAVFGLASGVEVCMLPRWGRAWGRDCCGWPSCLSCPICRPMTAAAKNMGGSKKWPSGACSSERWWASLCYGW